MIGLYSPEIPPVPGGVADQTLMLARALERRGDPVAVCARRGDAERFAPIPVRMPVDPATLAGVVRELGITGLYVQYVPFLYARFGVAPRLAPALRRVRAAGVKVALFVHEPFVPFTRLPWLVTGVLQRRQLRSLVRSVDRVYSAVPGFAAICRRFSRDPAQVVVAPIGANFRPSALPKADARARLGLEPGVVAIGVFSPAAAGYRVDWVRAAMDALASRTDIQWMVFGFGSDRLFPAAPANVRAMGPLEADRVADTARALDLFVAPYADGLTMRRGGAMMGLAAGLPLVSNTGQWFDPALGAYAACEPDVAAFIARITDLADHAAHRDALAARAAASAPISSMDSLAAIVANDLGGR